MPTYARTPAPIPKNGAHALNRTPLRAIYIILAATVFSLSLTAGYAESTPSPIAPPLSPSPFTYADVADLASRADLIAVVHPRSFAKVVQDGVAPSLKTQRFYVDAQLDSLIRGNVGMPSRIAFLLDVPLAEKPSRTMKGKAFVLFGRPGGRPGEFQLLSSNALLPSSPATDARVHAIAAELVAQEAPPEIVRVVEAFHVEGTVAGESETQIFLATKSGRPVSLSVVRRPDMPPRFGAALGEIVDEAADVPAPDTLLWYRLACGLPATLPRDAVIKLDAPSARFAADDYRSFMERLGSCARTRPPFGAPPVLGKPTDGG
jgi:hypothetical protein